jgi:hypothetical protein
VFDYLYEAGWPHSIVEVAREGFRRTNEMLCPLVALLSCEHRQATRVESDDLPPEVMIDDIPGWALDDVYSREGRAAFTRFLDTLTYRRRESSCTANSERSAFTVSRH